MHIAICDDQQTAVDTLYRAIKNYFADKDLTLSSLTTYTDGNELLNNYKQNKQLDVLFLDIDMPSISGMEVAQKLRDAGSNTLLVFVTSYPDFMASSFQVETFDFLTKPVSTTALYATLKRCIKKYQQQHGKLTVKTSIGISTIYFPNILYIKSTAHYVTFVLKDGSQITSLMTLSQLEERLRPFPQFARCHQSYIANLDYIQDAQKKNLILSPEYHKIIDAIPISRRYSTIIGEKFLRYHF